MAILTGLIALVVAAFYGGWEWVLLSFVALVSFPYAMQLAVQMPDVMKGRVSKPALVGGGGIMTVFMLIRITNRQLPTC